MKKSFLVAIIALVCGTMAYAQPRAVGGRIGINDDFVYQHSLSDKTFIELNAGLFDWWNGVHVDFLHEWIWLTPQWTEKGEWNWFAGVGANVGWKWNDPHPVYNSSVKYTGSYNARPILVGAIGNIGLEYNFWFPLSLAVDYRPTLGVLAGKDAGSIITDDGTILPFRFYTNGLWDLAISVRYKFNQ